MKILYNENNYHKQIIMIMIKIMIYINNNIQVSIIKLISKSKYI